VSSSRSRRVPLLELARRRHGAVEVTLSWDRNTSTATVVVWNWSTGACLALNADATEAQYAFAHPYAHAAALGVPDREVRLVI
jgi:hypothetical protein